MPLIAPCGKVCPWRSAAAPVPTSNPKNAPWPVLLFQNMPSRKVAKSAFTKANTNCRDGAARGKEVCAGAHETLENDADAQHKGEIQQHDEPIDGGQFHDEASVCIFRDEEI